MLRCPRILLKRFSTSSSIAEDQRSAMSALDHRFTLRQYFCLNEKQFSIGFVLRSVWRRASGS